MLVLTRKLGETIVISDNIKVTVIGISGKQVKLGIEAPRGIAVHREEVFQKIKEENILASNWNIDINDIKEILKNRG